MKRSDAKSKPQVCVHCKAEIFSSYYGKMQVCPVCKRKQ